MVVFWAALVGLFTGFSAGVGASRMYHIPEKQGLGAFRTLGEINSCNGDPVSHMAFGLGFFFNAAATALASGVLTQDVVQRIIPNWGIALASTFSRKKDNFQIIKSPVYLGIASAIIGVLTMTLLVGLYQFIPKELGKIGDGVLGPAAKLLFEYVMPIIFLMAAMDAGVKVGTTSLFFGVLFQIFASNSLPGIILGIIVGSAWKHAGIRSLQFWLLFLLVAITVAVIGYLRIISTDKMDWNWFIHFAVDPITQKAKGFTTSLQAVQGNNFDWSIMSYPGIINEV